MLSICRRGPGGGTSGSPCGAHAEIVGTEDLKLWEGKEDLRGLQKDSLLCTHDPQIDQAF